MDGGSSEWFDEGDDLGRKRGYKDDVVTFNGERKECYWQSRRRVIRGHG